MQPVANLDDPTSLFRFHEREIGVRLLWFSKCASLAGRKVSPTPALKLQNRPLAEDMGEIAKAAERARTLADQLIAFSRRQITQQEILNLNQIVSETCELLRRTVGSHIQIDLSLDHAIQDVEVDAGQIQRVLLNLVLNARDAMPEGGRISIATRMADAPASTATTMGSATSLVALTVTDTGGGMNAGTKKRVFEPFFTTKEFGSGLGLASVYRIVKQHGGEIRVESELGRGTMVEILLPRASSPWQNWSFSSGGESRWSV